MKISIVNGSSEVEKLQQMYVISSWAAKEALNEGRKFCPIYEYDQVFDTYSVFHHHSDPFNTKEEIEEHYKLHAIGHRFRVCPFCKKKTVSCDDYKVINYEGYSFWDREIKKIYPVFKCSSSQCNDVLEYYGMSIEIDHLNLSKENKYKNRRNSICRKLGVSSGELYLYEAYKDDNAFDIMLLTWLEREAKGCK